MVEISKTLASGYQALTNYLGSKDRAHSDGKVAIIALCSLSGTAASASCAVLKGFSFLGAGVGVGGALITVLYCLHQMYVQDLPH
jgi:hypothetical protein